jgi:outer membrane murein-binding lipoprotein Lpp
VNGTNIQRLARIINATMRASCGVSALAIGIIMSASMTASGQGITEIMGASEQIADSLSTDVTRLALQVAALSMALNVVLFLAHIKIQMLQLSKPCLIPGQIAAGVLRDAVREVARALSETEKR